MYYTISATTLYVYFYALLCGHKDPVYLMHVCKCVLLAINRPTHIVCDTEVNDAILTHIVIHVAVGREGGREG